MVTVFLALRRTPLKACCCGNRFAPEKVKGCLLTPLEHTFFELISTTCGLWVMILSSISKVRHIVLPWQCIVFFSANFAQSNLVKKFQRTRLLSISCFFGASLKPPSYRERKLKQIDLHSLYLCYHFPKKDRSLLLKFIDNSEIFSLSSKDQYLRGVRNFRQIESC